MKMPGPLLATIQAQARDGYPFEVCGILVGRRGRGVRHVEVVVPVPNRETESPRLRYQIAPEDVARIQRQARESGLEILGYYHSHPDHPARPSETDRQLAAEGLSDGVVHLIVGVAPERAPETSAWIFEDLGGAFVEEPVVLG
jgi:proteasome lid subunit RPN8/RPN11